MLPYVRGCGRPASRIGWPGRRPSASVQTAIHGTAMIVSTSGSLMHSMTTETSSRSADERVEREVGRLRVRARRRARPASGRPTRDGWPRTRSGARPSPDPRRRSPSPEMPRAISARTQVADVRVGERLHAGVDAEALEGRRQDRREGRGGGRVRVLVGGDVETLGPGRLEPGDGLAGPAPDRPRPALEVRDLEPGRRTRRPDRRDRLVQRREQPVALVAHVGRVQAAAPRRRRREAPPPRRPRRASPARR